MSWNRRDFIRTTSLGALAGLVPPASLMGSIPFRRASWTVAPLDFTELRRNVGIFTSPAGGTIGWLVNGDGALVVDSQFPDSAAECLEGLEARGADVLDALVNTHHHGDHVGGNGVFQDAARRIVAHEGAERLHREVAGQDGTTDQQTFPDTTFPETWEIDVGDETVRARHYGPAHTGGDAVIHFQEADVVHMGDLVFDGLHPFIDRPGGASVQGWIELLEAVASEHGSGAVFVFGHARPDLGVTGDAGRLLVQRDYLTELLETARGGIAEGRSREEIVATESLSGFEEYVGPADFITLEAGLGVAYDELTD